jgi:hypothetical protein
MSNRELLDLAARDDDVLELLKHKFRCTLIRQLTDEIGYSFDDERVERIATGVARYSGFGLSLSQAAEEALQDDLIVYGDPLAPQQHLEPIQKGDYMHRQKIAVIALTFGIITGAAYDPLSDRLSAWWNKPEPPATHIEGVETYNKILGAPPGKAFIYIKVKARHRLLSIPSSAYPKHYRCTIDSEYNLAYRSGAWRLPADLCEELKP